MPITFLANTVTNMAATLLSYQRDATHYVNHLLRSLISVEPSYEEMNARVEEVTDMFRSGFKMLDELKSADKFHEEQIPHYIASGRKIRIAVERLNDYCSGVPVPPLSDKLCDDLVELAMVNQLGTYDDMDKHIPTTLEPVLRKKILHNVFFEEFPAHITNLQIT